MNRRGREGAENGAREREKLMASFFLAFFPACGETMPAFNTKRMAMQGAVGFSIKLQMQKKK